MSNGKVQRAGNFVTGAISPQEAKSSNGPAESGMRVTAWYRRDDRSGEYVYNHWERGWGAGDRPEPKFKAQRVWDDCEWIKERTWLIDGVLV